MSPRSQGCQIVVLSDRAHTNSDPISSISSGISESSTFVPPLLAVGAVRTSALTSTSLDQPHATPTHTHLHPPTPTNTPALRCRCTTT